METAGVVVGMMKMVINSAVILPLADISLKPDHEIRQDINTSKRTQCYLWDLTPPTAII